MRQNWGRSWIGGGGGHAKVDDDGGTCNHLLSTSMLCPQVRTEVEMRCDAMLFHSFLSAGISWRGLIIIVTSGYRIHHGNQGGNVDLSTFRRQACVGKHPQLMAPPGHKGSK